MSNEQPLQPCEICGKTEAPGEDEKYDDLFTPARPGSKAAQLGLDKERLCGRCACAQFIGSYWNGTPDRKRTPIEQYVLPAGQYFSPSKGNRVVYVKRDDLWMNGKYGGGNAKLRGAEIRLRGLQESGITHVAMMDAKTSRAGWGVADLCKALGMKYTGFFGRRKGQLTTIPYDRNQFEIVKEKDIEALPYFQQRAAAAGAELIAMPASRVYPMYYKARKYCQERGIYLLPMGLQLTEAMLSVAGEASTLPRKLITGTVVCVVATGTMFAGMLMGLKGTPRVIGVYIGMTSGEINGRVKSDPEAIVRNRIKGLLPAGFEPMPFEIKLSDREYYDRDDYPCPFSCDPWYDRKCWRWLCEHIAELEGPILYWNIG